MKYQLICTDIDGTLLDDEKRLPEKVRQSLKEAEEKGVRIALVSGRMPSGVENIERELGVACIKVCNAGTYISMNGQCIGSWYLSIDTMEEIWREITEKYEIPLWIFREREWFVTRMDSFVKKEIQTIHGCPAIMDAERLAKIWRRRKTGPSKLLIAAEPELLQKIMGEVAAHGWKDIDIARSADTFLEIFPKGINKGTALYAICEELGIAPEQTIAFGDHELDIPMLEAAGVGVAMGNAIQSVKEKADFIAETNNNGGIAQALGKYLAEE